MVDASSDSVAGSGSELRADAVDVLRDVQQWRLTGRRWGAVEAALETMSSALSGGDPATFRAAVHDLELSGPTRATPFGEDPMVPPPPPVIEEVAELIFILDGRQPATPAD